MQKLLSVVLLILLIIATLTGCQTKSPEVSVKPAFKPIVK